MIGLSSINSVTQTITRRIWNAVKDDKELKKVIRSEEQISTQAPSDEKAAQLSIYLYNITEYTNMRNQPQNPQQPRTLLYLNLRYLITPLTRNSETDQLVLGKILQFMAEKPILRGTDLQGSLSGSGEELKITLDAASVDEQNKLWTMLSTPYKLSVSYSIYPVQIKSETMPETQKPAAKKPIAVLKREPKKEKSA